MEDQNTNTTTNKHKLNLALDLRLVVLALLVVIVGMLAFWRPWSEVASASDQVISVTGETKVKATPDEYVFYPSYQFSNADKDAALAELTKKSNQIVAELKKLGVADEKIKTNSNGFDYPERYNEPSNTTVSYNLQLTVTVDKKELAQKVQDYLVTTTPTGSVTPQATFSTAKRKQLETTAREQATKDARAKADQMAENLGFKVGKVKSVSDGQGLDSLPLMQGNATMARDAAEAPSQLNLQPGENELNYSVTVTYYIR